MGSTPIPATNSMNPVPKAQPDKEFVKFCNSLRCPLCDAQLDGNIHPKKARLYCARDNREYKTTYLPGEAVPETEFLIYWYPIYEYEINIVRMNYDMFVTCIDRFEAGVISRYRDSTRKRVFDNKGARIPFFRKRMEEEVFLKKLKTYQVFS